jgi:hypothetical protein
MLEGFCFAAFFAFLSRGHMAIFRSGQVKKNANKKAANQNPSSNT